MGRARARDPPAGLAGRHRVPTSAPTPRRCSRERACLCLRPHGTHEPEPSILKQPTAVWAIAFACVVAFMGIGLVDPILPAIAESLKASPTQTELLFTSYLLVTGVAMFFTSWVSSRLGAKRTLLIGLALIVVFALLAATQRRRRGRSSASAPAGGSATPCSSRPPSRPSSGRRRGGTASAIILYEAALGLGIAIGPLLGGLLGSVSWRGPFFGVTTLMAIAFIAIVLFLKGGATEKPTPDDALGPVPRPRAARPSAPSPSTALFYNIGFFVLLAYTPYPLGFGALGIGLTFFGWGVGLAITSRLGRPAADRTPAAHDRAAHRAPPARARPRRRRRRRRDAGRPRRLRRRRRPGARRAEHRAHRVRHGGDRPAPLGRVLAYSARALPRRRRRPARRDACSPTPRPERRLRGSPPRASPSRFVVVVAARGALRRVDDGPEPARVEAEAIGAGEAI